MRKLIVVLLGGCFLLPGHALRAEESTETAADVLRIALPAAAYGLTFLKDDREGRPMFYKSFLSTVGATYILKVAIDAEGPNGEGQSFPSGHTSMAFSGASFLQRRYGWHYGLPAYLAASFVGWSRIDSDDHEVTDVLAGAALGTGFSYLFTDRLEDKGWQAVPAVDKNLLGFRLQGAW